MGTPRRQNVKSIWLFDEVTEEFSENIMNPLVASDDSAPSSSLVEPGLVETTHDAPLPVSSQEEEVVANYELLSAPSSSLVEPGRVEITCDAPLSISTQEKESFLQSLCDHISCSFPELALTMAVDSSSGSPVLTITQKNLFNHPPFGLTSRIQVIVQYTSCTASVLMRTWKAGEVRSVEDVIKLCHDFSNQSVYKFCPGIDPQYYEEEYHKIIRFHIKSVRLNQFPFMHVDSNNCKLWFIPASNISAVEKSANEVKCPACKRLVHDLNCQKRRTVAESPSRKIKCDRI